MQKHEYRLGWQCDLPGTIFEKRSAYIPGLSTSLALDIGYETFK